jgi:hypothetical protein
MNLLRLIMVVILMTIIINGKYQLLYYAAVMIGSIEFLNQQKSFRNSPNHKLLNAVFISYLVLIILNRTRHFKCDNFTEGVINIGEHSFFALVICLKLLVYLHLFSNFSFRLKAIFTFLFFNLIGLINEIFQNQLNHRSLLLFIEDARKDMIINALGSILFLSLALSNHLNSIKK